MLNLNDLLLFAQAVEAGGFAPASRRHATPKSTLSKRVAALEADVGTRLIQRNSRNFQLTDVGRAFYEHARAALIEVEAAEQAVQRRLAEPSGPVRLTASLPTTQFRLAPLLPELARRYPKLEIQMHATDRFVDLAQEGFDIALRAHFKPLADSGLVQRQLTVEPVLLVASPGYLREHGTPRHPRDLAGHCGLLVAPDAGTWVLRANDGKEERATPTRQLVADESVVLITAACAGLGIAPSPHSICSGALVRGELVRVLPRWSAGAVTTTVLMTHRRGQLPSVRAVVEFLAEKIGGAAAQASTSAGTA
ncbi:LysR substrate-binding domain-containing protein [Ramlibacter sp.]|uniref:LysR substrate-binding domain-containing protein n=1 Tax=Ramlibacter sp. TaxID=1917967 RepID=UPI0017A43288|nr:LysR substrate-binding domain-containing protein [Ramlibacter sp.]MBA2675961.1 LysR family transcriptional regulator [Ramlibacter sp.]